MSEQLIDREIMTRRDFNCTLDWRCNQGRCECHDGKLERDVITVAGERVATWLCFVGLGLVVALICFGWL
jgi:hypothetical protein